MFLLWSAHKCLPRYIRRQGLCCTLGPCMIGSLENESFLPAISSAQICGSIRNCSVPCVQGGWVWPRLVNSPSLALSWENSSAETPVDTRHTETRRHSWTPRGRWKMARRWTVINRYQYSSAIPHTLRLNKYEYDTWIVWNLGRYFTARHTKIFLKMVILDS